MYVYKRGRAGPSGAPLFGMGCAYSWPEPSAVGHSRLTKARPALLCTGRLDARVLCVRRQLGRGLAAYDHLPPTDGTTRVRRGAQPVCRWQIMSRTMGKSGNGIPRNWGWRVGAKVPVERGGQRRVARRHLVAPGAGFWCEALLHAHTCVLRPRAQACGPLPWSFTCQRSVKCVYACVRV